MMSGSQLRTATAITDPARQTLRLALKPKAAAMGTLDGGWWPRSLNPLGEFPALIAGFRLRLGQVDRLAFNTDVWPGAPRRMLVDGETIRLEGFHSLDPCTVLVSGSGWHRMALLVIPPDAAEDAADAALARAASLDNVEGPAQILDASGAGRSYPEATVPAPRTVPGDAVSSWDDDGGRVYERD